MSLRRFEFCSLTFQFQACEPFVFPAYLTGNIFRGALGSFLHSANPSAYRVLFGPGTSDDTASATPPRPFVLRCRNLDGHSYSPGEIFPLRLNLFLYDEALIDALAAAFTAMGQTGFGPSRSHARLLLPPEQIQHSLPLDEPLEPTREIRIRFETPTEFKSAGEVVSPQSFSVLFEQVYARLNRLSTLYGSGKLAIDEKALRKQARSVILNSLDLKRADASRRGTRLGQTHGIGGWLGSAEYSGDLTPFWRLLEAASFTGIGRHTVWGNGEISTERIR